MKKILPLFKLFVITIMSCFIMCMVGGLCYINEWEAPKKWIDLITFGLMFAFILEGTVIILTLAFSIKDE